MHRAGAQPEQAAQAQAHAQGRGTARAAEAQGRQKRGLICVPHLLHALRHREVEAAAEVRSVSLRSRCTEGV